LGIHWPGLRGRKRCARQRLPYHLQDAVTVLDPDTMQPVPADGETMGEIMFRGNIAMKGYLKNPEATEAALAGFKVPKVVVFRAIPKTSTGKIQKFSLREQMRSIDALR
jgi:acyl-CoA synthetase (AMP-forming)/AMP-acid ligase II